MLTNYRKNKRLSLNAALTFLTSLSVLSPSCAATEIDLSDCMVQTSRWHSSGEPDQTYGEMRALALVKAGHFRESIPCFLQALADPNVFHKELLEKDCGQVYENLSDVSEATRHYNNAGLFYAGRLQAALLIKERRFSKAKDVCERGVREAQQLALRYEYPYLDPNIGDWLRLKAESDDRLNQGAAALSDLKEASAYFAQTDSKKLNNCIKSFNDLSKKNFGKNLDFSASDLPSKDKDSMLRFLQFFSGTTKPVQLNDINKFTRATLSLPTRVAHECAQQDRASPAFWNIQYRLTKDFDPSTSLLQIRVWTKNCAIDKKTIMQALSKYKANSSPVYSCFGDAEMKDAESWSYPEGTLILSFSSSAQRLRIADTNESDRPCGFYSQKFISQMVNMQKP